MKIWYMKRLSKRFRKKRYRQRVIESVRVQLLLDVLVSHAVLISNNSNNNNDGNEDHANNGSIRLHKITKGLNYLARNRGNLSHTKTVKHQLETTQNIDDNRRADGK